MILSTYIEQILTSNEIVKSTKRNVNMAIYYIGGLEKCYLNERTVLICEHCSDNDSLIVFCVTYCGHNCPVGQHNRCVPLPYYTIYMNSLKTSHTASKEVDFPIIILFFLGSYWSCCIPFNIVFVFQLGDKRVYHAIFKNQVIVCAGISFGLFFPTLQP